MGMFSRKGPPPAVVDPGQATDSSSRPSGDPEKADKDVQLENTNIAARPHIDPELERRVVRKLDWHVPPLVAFLCTSRHKGNVGVAISGTME